ncbi:hypothetical protein AB0F91_11625 [Amycolatopsis sp. NPDC023774]|uniref:hypothetical protein n=1 Tax=Amycolatopsis sp. NPDC023774 TaxID=3155015 RepID=UPI0033F926EF
MVRLVVLAAAVASAPSGGFVAGPVAPFDGGGVLTAAGLLYFAFAGVRVAGDARGGSTDATRTIPRAIPIALG